MSGQAKRSNRYDEQFIRMVRLPQGEWADECEPFPGAVKELTNLITIRLMADALLRHEEGDRSGAIRLAGMARDIAPAARWRVLADLVRQTITHTSPSLIRRLRAFATHFGRGLTGDNTAHVRVGQPRSRHYLLGLVDDLRDDLHRQDPKLGPPVSLEEIADTAGQSARGVSG
jgi:hypothetical protein